MDENLRRLRRRNQELRVRIADLKQQNADLVAALEYFDSVMGDLYNRQVIHPASISHAWTKAVEALAQVKEE